MKIEIEHKFIIPKSIIDSTLDEINKNIITFGVHKEDNNKHTTRDIIQSKPLHKALYYNGNNPTSIGNAELLMKNEKGFESVLYINNSPKLIQVPSRPVLQPIIIINFQMFDSIKRGLKKQLQFSNPNSFKNSLNRFKISLNNSVFDFIKNRGMGFWENAEHNNPYTQAVKFFDMVGDYSILTDTGKYIKDINKWQVGQNYRKGDMPLMDSLDLIKSIKAKVERKE